MYKTEFPFLLVEQNNGNNEEESDFSDNNKKNNKINKFEKFRPKNAPDMRKSQIYLKGAESNLKSMLSVFLKDIEQEERVTDMADNNYIKKKTQKEVIMSKFNRKDQKRNSVSSSKLNFGRGPKMDKLKNYNLKNQTNNNNNLKRKSNNKINNFYFNNNLYKNEAINNKASNKLKNLSNVTNLESDTSAAKKNKRIDSSAGILESMISSGNKMNSLNDSSNCNLLLPNESKQKVNQFNNNSNTFLSESFSSISPGNKMNYMKNKLENKKKRSNITDEKNNMKNLNINEHINNNNDISKRVLHNNTNKNNIINDLKNFNDILLSEDSYNTMNSLDELNKQNSKSFNNELMKVMSFRSTKEMNKLKEKRRFLNIDGKNNNKLNNEIGIIKHANTQTKEKRKNKNEFINRKFYKSNLQLKSMKKKLKESLSLRPECMTSLNKKNKKKSRSVLDLPFVNLKKSKLNLEKINKKDLERKNRSSINNIKIIIPKVKMQKQKKNAERKSKENIQFTKQNSLKHITSLDHKNIINTPKTPKYRILRRRANLYDSLDDEEFEDAEEINNIFIHPNSNFILFFDFLILIFSGFISFIMVPYYLARTHYFCRKKFLFGLFDISFAFIFTELLNILDLFLSFFRGYYNWEEQLIYRKKMIIKNYLSGWFLFDLISAIPIYTINKLNEPICNDFLHSTIYYNIILNVPHYILLCAKLLKLLKVFYKNQAWKIISNHLNDSASLLISICLVILALNYAGSLYIFIARNNYPNWILNTNLDTSSFFDIYICSIYILIMAMTTVGYGDITCYSFWERVFQIFLLVVGILAYSWAVTSFSNYIKKINEKSADFQNKKGILDEIKLNNQNMPDELYDKILRHLKFKNFHEKKLKSIIFDCLPVSLKNSLIFEMYKPIINNFLFFKNFQNTDFIVRVILSFRPIIAGKNDILINDSDMVEDIMFVKKGVLSVELPINMSNPQENIDKYLNMTLDPEKDQDPFKSGNSPNLYSKLNNPNLKNNLGNFLENSKHNSSYKQSTFNSNILGSGYEKNNKSSSFSNNRTMTNKAKKEKDIIRYVRILCIRNNEHFGDVLMFLEKRSPLRVRVKSKKAELFFLRKMDAIKISTNYPNIWRRINKKSIFNFKQIKKSIHKIVEIYCSVKKLYSIEEESSDSIYNELIKQNKTMKEETAIRPKSFILNNPNSKGVYIIKKSNTFQNINTSSLKKIMIKHNLEMLNSKNINNKFPSSSVKVRNNIKLQLNLLTKCSSLRKKRKHGSLNNRKKVTFSTKGKTESANKCETIKEDISKEDAYSKIKSTNSFRNISKITVSSKNIKYKFSSVESNIKSTNIINDNKKIISNNTINSDDDDNSNNNSNSNSKSNINKNSSNNYKKISSIKKKNNIYSMTQKALKTIKLDDSSSLQLINDENIDSLGKDEEKQSNLSYNKLINDEIYPGEEIQLKKDEPLLLKKKVDYDYQIKKEILINDNNNKCYNKKLQLLLKCLDDNNEANKNTNSNSNSINSNNNNNEYNIIKNTDSNNLPDTHISLKKKVWENESLIITNNISFKYNSSYDNCNKICGGKLVGNKLNQFKLKKILREEILFENKFFRRQSIEPGFNNKMNINFNNNLKQGIKEKSDSILNKNRTLSILKQSKKKLKKYTTLADSTSSVVNSNIKNKQKLHRTASYNKGITENNRLIKHDETYLSFRKSKKKLNNNYLSTKNITKYSHLMGISNEKSRKNLKLNTVLSPKTKTKKKKDDLLSKISSNIRKTNENLNNPDEFYSNYFNSIMSGIPKGDKSNNFMKNFSFKK